eukprot:m.204436 g.204436  ORF g.204436 m.204436 type:complete len:51 (+) comp32888_c1_seq1:254-406(+)
MHGHVLDLHSPETLFLSNSISFVFDLKNKFDRDFILQMIRQKTVSISGAV